MNKSITLIILTVFVCTGIAWCAKTPLANRVQEVRIVGNIHVKSWEILDKIDTKRGSEFSVETINQDLGKIYEMEKFDNVSVQTEETDSGVIVTFEVKEKLQISQIEFKGNEEFSKNKLKGQIDIKNKDFFDSAQMDAATEKIVKFYYDHGYVDAQVEAYKKTDEEKNTCVVTFYVREGKKMAVGDITASGVYTFPEKKIIKLIKVRRGKVYQADKFDEGLDRVINFYKEKGYSDVRISGITRSFNEKRTEIYISVVVYEGPCYIVEDVVLTGNMHFSTEELKKYTSMIKIGKPLKNSDIEQSIAAVMQVYGDNGYLQANVSKEIIKDADNGLATVRISIVEDGLFYIGSIGIEGNDTTKDYVIEREIVAKSGSIFAIKDVRKSQQNIYNLGFFSDVQLHTTTGALPNIIDLTFQVVEQKTGIASLGVGYSSQDEFVFSGQVSHTNLFGRAKRIDVLVELGAKRQNYKLSYTEPWLFRQHMPLVLEIYDTTLERLLSDERYIQHQRGAAAQLGRYITDTLSAHLGYRWSQDKFNPPEGHTFINPELIELETKDKTRTSGITTSMVYDNRDDVFDPAHGTRSTLSVGIKGGILGGDWNFAKTTVDSSWFIQTFWKFVLAMDLRFGFVSPLGAGEEIPFYERFRIGGAETVRGYQYEGDVGASDGGREMLIMNLEYKFPIYQERGHTILQGAFFYDVGGSWHSWSDVRFTRGPEEEDMKAGAGFGIRFVTPVFPIRLDFGWGLDKIPWSPSPEVHFTLGQAF